MDKPAVLAIEYERLWLALGPDPGAQRLGDALTAALAEHYEEQWSPVALHQFVQSDAVYLFDFASSGGLPQEDRTVAAWATTPADVGVRDVNYQRGYPMEPDPDLPAVDRGHLIPHLSGGEFGPNIFRQDRALNRGWSEEGKRYRALEREAAATPGCFFFGHLIYTDLTATPARVEIGLLRGGTLYVESFDNRPPG